MIRPPSAMTAAEMAAIDEAAHEAVQADPPPSITEEQAARIRPILRRSGEPAT